MIQLRNLRRRTNLAAPVLASYVKAMPMRREIAIAVVLAAFFAAPPAYSQRSYDIMVEEGGKRPPKARKTEEQGQERTQKKPPKSRPRGSSYVPNMTLPRSEPARVAPPSVEVYKPPQINTYSDRVRNCIHSYPLNAGIGNNPTDQSAYIRQCSN
jgi:hypothetical protein